MTKLPMRTRSELTVAGDQDIELRFRPWSTIAGAGVTLTSLLVLAVLGWRARRRGDIFSRAARSGTLACIVIPWVVAGSAYALSPDPRFPPPTLRNANGTPAVVDVAEEKQVPATPLGASFELPIRVEAGSVKGPDPLDNLVFDIYLRRTGPIPRATTMFVHLERRSAAEQPGPPTTRESFFNADHQVISGSFYLSDTPQGRLVHDAHGVHLKEAAPGVWDVYVAFGHVSGRNGRAKLTDPGAATVSSDRVRIGSFVISP